jgi:spermidine synthase
MIVRKRLVLLVALLLSSCSRADEKILFEQDSQYNTVVVTEDDQGLRTLWFERGGARQSVVKPGDPDHLELAYARAMLVGLGFDAQPKRVLVVGLGGGTLPGFLHVHYPQAKIDVVDIDPVVVEVAKRYFGFREDETMRAHVADGRRFIEQSREPYDLIMLDAFGSDNIPYHLATRQFLEAVRRALAPGGVVVANVWSRASNPLYDAMVRTYQEVFDELYVFDVRGTGNKILVALPRARRLSRDDLGRRADDLTRQQRLRFDLRRMVDYGYQYMTEKDPDAEVLVDREEGRRAG